MVRNLHDQQIVKVIATGTEATHMRRRCWVYYMVGSNDIGAYSGVNLRAPESVTSVNMSILHGMTLLKSEEYCGWIEGEGNRER